MAAGSLSKTNMAKLGFEIPEKLERRLRKHVAWGNKGKVIEGLLLVMVARLERGDGALLLEATSAYWREHD